MNHNGLLLYQCRWKCHKTTSIFDALEMGIFIVLGVPASTPWWTFISLLPPLILPVVSRRLKGGGATSGSKVG
jgi:hypothetical protein